MSLLQKISFCPGKGDLAHLGSSWESRRGKKIIKRGAGERFTSSESITGGSALVGEGVWEHLSNAANRSDISDIAAGEREGLQQIELGLREGHNPIRRCSAAAHRAAGAREPTLAKRRGAAGEGGSCSSGAACEAENKAPPARPDSQGEIRSQATCHHPALVLCDGSPGLASASGTNRAELPAVPRLPPAGCPARRRHAALSASTPASPPCSASCGSGSGRTPAHSRGNLSSGANCHLQLHFTLHPVGG